MFYIYIYIHYIYLYICTYFIRIYKLYTCTYNTYIYINVKKKIQDNYVQKLPTLPPPPLIAVKITQRSTAKPLCKVCVV